MIPACLITCAVFITVVILRYHHEQQPSVQEYAVEENVNKKEDMGEEENSIKKGEDRREKDN